ncbi:hypothetical protein DFH06DRAFT_1144290 [Mycena polygramma]|nr:hypothetical protein DFH06DRAFT_1144290 [Mycena polygramma]
MSAAQPPHAAPSCLSLVASRATARRTRAAVHGRATRDARRSRELGQGRDDGRKCATAQRRFHADPVNAATSRPVGISDAKERARIDDNSQIIEAAATALHYCFFRGHGELRGKRDCKADPGDMAEVTTHGVSYSGTLCAGSTSIIDSDRKKDTVCGWLDENEEKVPSSVTEQAPLSREIWGVFGRDLDKPVPKIRADDRLLKTMLPLGGRGELSAAPTVFDGPAKNYRFKQF